MREVSVIATSPIAEAGNVALPIALMPFRLANALDSVDSSLARLRALDYDHGTGKPAELMRGCFDSVRKSWRHDREGRTQLTKKVGQAKAMLAAEE
jgi:hypothetical protein